MQQNRETLESSETSGIGRPIRDKKSSDRRRLLGEGVVIVASILLAFAIEAVWAQRQLRDEEREALIELEADFVASLDQIDIVGDDWQTLQVPDFEIAASALAPPMQVLAEEEQDEPATTASDVRRTTVEEVTLLDQPLSEWLGTMTQRARTS